MSPALALSHSPNAKGRRLLTTMSRYGVPIIRVPETSLTPHRRACSLSDLKSYAKTLNVRWHWICSPVPGGLSLGLQEAGFEVILGVDSYPYAVATHRATLAVFHCVEIFLNARL